MNVVQPGYHILTIPESTDQTGVLKHLERVGRVCYKSEDRISDISCRKFIQNIRDRKHWAMLEHYIFVFELDMLGFEELYNDEYTHNAGAPELSFHMNFIQGTRHFDTDGNPKYIVSMSATALNYVFEDYVKSRCVFTTKSTILEDLFLYMLDKHPELMKVPLEYYINPDRERKSSIRLLSRKEISNLPTIVRRLHDFMTVDFIVDRGITHELVRHRPCSWAQESTRYCNYTNGKFGQEITVIDPSFFKATTDGQDMGTKYIWRKACKFAENEYINLIKFGATPQEARSVLPNSLKAEIVMTARMIEMRHFFKMRADKAAHPQMREVVVPLLKECIDKDRYMFKDLEWLIEE